VIPARLRLTSPALLRLLMTWAPGGGVSVRGLADQAGVSKSKIQALLSETRVTVDVDTADRISAALHVHRGALFLKPHVHAHGRGQLGGEA
jgi:hypothetical protein